MYPAAEPTMASLVAVPCSSTGSAAVVGPWDEDRCRRLLTLPMCSPTRAGLYPDSLLATMCWYVGAPRIQAGGCPPTLPDIIERDFARRRSGLSLLADTILTIATWLVVFAPGSARMFRAINTRSSSDDDALDCRGRSLMRSAATSSSASVLHTCATRVASRRRSARLAC